jgi:hypothetical protein
MDWSSFFKLTDKASIDLLKVRLTTPGDPMRLREALGPFLTDILARLVVYDGLLLDAATEETFQNPLSSEAARIVQIRFESDIYQTAADSVFRFLTALKRTSADLAPLFNSDALFFGDLKSYTDRVARGFHGLGSTIGDSNLSAPRALFYLELSRQIGLQLFLSYEKRDLLKNLGKMLWGDAFAIVAGVVDKTVMKDHTAETAIQDVRLQTPAVVDLVIRRAFDRKLTLEESIIEVRNLEGAQQFRELLAKIQSLMMIGDKASMLRVDKLLAPLLKAAKTWSEAADPRVRLLWNANVSKLPWIGPYLEAIGIKTPALPIKTRFKSYVQFVSEWYKASGEDSEMRSSAK